MTLSSKFNSLPFLSLTQFCPRLSGLPINQLRNRKNILIFNDIKLDQINWTIVPSGLDSHLLPFIRKEVVVVVHSASFP